MLAKTETTEPRVVNGINVDDLLGLIEGVRDDAARGNTQWRVTTVWQGQTRSRARVEGFAIGGQKVPREFSIDIDEPYELGGSKSIRKSAGTLDSSAQCLHDGGLRGAVRGARNHPRKT